MLPHAEAMLPQMVTKDSELCSPEHLLGAQEPQKVLKSQKKVIVKLRKKAKKAKIDSENRKINKIFCIIHNFQLNLQ